MKTFRFLISSIGGDLSQNVARCLRNDFPDSFIVGLDIQRRHAGTLFSDDFKLIDHADSDIFLEQLAAIIQETKPDFFIPLNENELRRFASMDPQHLNSVLNQCKIVWAGADIVNLFSAKSSTMQFLNKIGVMTPKVYESPYLESIRFPVIVKPNQSSGSRNLFICENTEDLQRAIAFVDCPIIQEFIEGEDDEYTVGVFSGEYGKVHTIALRRKLSGGATSWCEVVNDVEIDLICKKIAAAIQLKGSINIQMRKKGNLYYVFEINPRFSSTVYIRSLCGFKDVLWSVTNDNKLNDYNPNSFELHQFVTYKSISRLP